MNPPGVHEHDWDEENVVVGERGPELVFPSTVVVRYIQANAPMRDPSQETEGVPLWVFWFGMLLVAVIMVALLVVG